MNIQQLEYIVAVDTYRHFAKASEKSFVTQPTLSAMVLKLEEELAIRIFDRSKQPVSPTKEGEEIIRRARHILHEINGIKNYAHELRGETTGELRLGIIPTLAPYLLPPFLKSFCEKHPELKLFIREMCTDLIIEGIKKGELDIGLLSTPLNETRVVEHYLFSEELLAYARGFDKISGQEELRAEEIDLNKLWLMEEGHCLRNQVLNLCEQKNRETDKRGLNYQAGSIEALINMVDIHNGMTIIPELAAINLKPSQKRNLYPFAEPRPIREIGLVVDKEFARKKLIRELKTEILLALPLNLNTAAGKRIPIDNILDTATGENKISA